MKQVEIVARERRTSAKEGVKGQREREKGESGRMVFNVLARTGVENVIACDGRRNGRSVSVRRCVKKLFVVVRFVSSST